MARNVRFYRVDGSYALVSREERDRRQAIQNRNAARAGREIVRDRRGRPRSLEPADAAAFRRRQASARKAARARVKRLEGTRDETTGQLQAPSGYRTTIDTSRIENIGQLIGEIMGRRSPLSGEKLHLAVAKRNGRSGMVRAVLHYRDGRTRVIPLSTFGPGGYIETAKGRARTLGEIQRQARSAGRSDWRPDLARAVLLAAPSAIEDSTDTEGSPADDRPEATIIDLPDGALDFGGERSEREDPAENAIPDAIESVDILSEYEQ